MVPNCGKWQKITKIGLFNAYNYHYGLFFPATLAAPINSRVFPTLSHSSHHYISKNKEINFVLSKVSTQNHGIIKSKHNQFNQSCFMIIPIIL